MDWADKIAEETVSSAFDDYGYIEDQGDLCDAFRQAAAKALRKAKADGVRLAADQWENPIYDEFKKTLYEMAGKIEALKTPIDTP